MYVCVWGGSWCANLGWMPLSTRPQQYCDPASLVSTCDNRVCSHLLRILHSVFFLSVHRLVCPPLIFLAFLSFLGSLLPPKCIIDIHHHCHCPPASDWGSHVSGHVNGPLSRSLHLFPHSLRSPPLRTLASLARFIHKLSHSLCSLPCGDS